MAKNVIGNTCSNPGCRRQFRPGHYGKLQKICKRKECKTWYRSFWAQTRKPPRGIPAKDIDTLMKGARIDRGQYALLVVARYSGMRKGELLGLTWGDVLDGGNVKSSIILKGQWSDKDGRFMPTKTGASRIAFLLDESRKALQSFYKKADPGLRDRIWDMSESAAWSWFTGLQKMLGISNPETKAPYRFHDLRHTAAVETYQSTGEIHRASVLLGHKNPATTMIYAQERPEEFVAALEKANKRKKR